MIPHENTVYQHRPDGGGEPGQGGVPHGAGLGRAEEVDGAVLGEAAAVDDLEVEADREPAGDLGGRSGAAVAAGGQGDVLDVGQLDVTLVRVGDALSRPAKY